ncbi:MAG: rhodanese-like domain-containing protein [Desulfobulbaceae bacterium]|nr:rhodanese-like domain-containing protein [Desulfobulbaceae bacterium]
MRKNNIFVLCTISLFFFVGNASAEQPKWMEGPTGKLVQEARSSTKQITIEDFKKILDADEDITLLDVRTPREYEAVHIPGAVNVSRGLLEFSIWSVVPDKNEEIVVYCKSGARAALATKQLNDFGYKNAIAIATGMTEWAKSGNPVQTSITDEQIILIPVEE